jgi:hypothetical protein
MKSMTSMTEVSVSISQNKAPSFGFYFTDSCRCLVSFGPTFDPAWLHAANQAVAFAVKLSSIMEFLVLSKHLVKFSGCQGHLVRFIHPVIYLDYVNDTCVSSFT